MTDDALSGLDRLLISLTIWKVADELFHQVLIFSFYCDCFNCRCCLDIFWISNFYRNARTGANLYWRIRGMACLRGWWRWDFHYVFNRLFDRAWLLRLWMVLVISSSISRTTETRSSRVMTRVLVSLGRKRQPCCISSLVRLRANMKSDSAGRAFWR